MSDELYVEELIESVRCVSHVEALDRFWNLVRPHIDFLQGYGTGDRIMHSLCRAVATPELRRLLSALEEVGVSVWSDSMPEWRHIAAEAWHGQA